MILIFLPMQNDVNDVEFFDVVLPREVALSIFLFLDYRDLCECSKVRVYRMMLYELLIHHLQNEI